MINYIHQCHQSHHLIIVIISSSVLSSSYYRCSICARLPTIAQLWLYWVNLHLRFCYLRFCICNCICICICILVIFIASIITIYVPEWTLQFRSGTCSNLENLSSSDSWKIGWTIKSDQIQTSWIILLQNLLFSTSKGSVELLLRQGVSRHQTVQTGHKS